MKNLNLILESVWLKGRPIEGYDPVVWRRDDADRPMLHDDYGDDESVFGWTVDHIVPPSAGGTDEISNLRPINCGAEIE